VLCALQPPSLAVVDHDRAAFSVPGMRVGGCGHQHAGPLQPGDWGSFMGCDRAASWCYLGDRSAGWCLRQARCPSTLVPCSGAVGALFVLTFFLLVWATTVRLFRCSECWLQQAWSSTRWTSSAFSSSAAQAVKRLSKALFKHQDGSPRSPGVLLGRFSPSRQFPVASVAAERAV